MKLLKITLSILAVLLCAAPSYPVSITAGLTAWYSMWWPEFEESFRGSDNAVTASDPENMSSAYGDSFSADQCFMAGPVVGLKFSDRWSMGLVFLAGTDVDVTSSFKVKGPLDTYTYHYDFSFRRYDSRSLDRNFFGMNAMAGVGYYFSPVSTTVILGGRLQYLNSDDEPRDIFCGVTLSAIYSF